jgi:hypothetical protein
MSKAAHEIFHKENVSPASEARRLRFEYNRLQRRISKYPPAKPGALVDEPLKAAEDAAGAASIALIASRAVPSSVEAHEPALHA